VGKPATFEDADDRIRFSCHDEVGATIARAVMERLRFARRDTDRVVALVGQHMVFKDVMQMREAKLRRLVAEAEFPELLELHRADCAASHGDLSTYEWVRTFLERLAGEPSVPPPLITGADVLALGLTPGPAVGRILRAVENARLEGEIRTREEALAAARALVASSREPVPDRGSGGSPET
jgi:tRNA nucleotidyltransferase/poly(A) polymerase